MGSPAMRRVSQCFIKPKHTPEASKQPLYLSPPDVCHVFVPYMQRGFIFAKPSGFDTDGDENQLQEFVEKLKESLSHTLVHFYPLAGRLATQKKEENPSDLAFYVDCNKGPGARFVHASLDLTIDAIISPTYIPQILRSLFDHYRLLNYDGHTESLLTIQVTELIDGIFMGCSMNHMLGDGTSLWHFLASWSEIFKAEGKSIAISRPPIHERWFPHGRENPFVSLPVIRDLDGQVTITRDEADTSPANVIKERIFHFSSESVRKLKAKANFEADTTEISSFQALSAHLWRCLLRAWNFPLDQITAFVMLANARPRSVPPISQDCFGNYVQPISAIGGCGKLLENGLGWTAWLLHQAVVNKEMSYEWINSRLQSLSLPRNSSVTKPGFIVQTGSPRFDLHAIDFGLGKPVATRTGNAGRSDGKIKVSPGAEGGGRTDILICLPPHAMTSLESDKEFMETVS